MSRTHQAEAHLRTCPNCHGNRFHLVGYRNATYLACAHCDATPFPARGRGAHLGHQAMSADEALYFKNRLGAPSGAPGNTGDQ